VRRNDANVTLDVDEALLVEMLRVDSGRVDVGEHLEFIGAAYIVAVAGHAVGDHPLALLATYLALDKGLDHPMFLGHAAYPTVRFDAHGFVLIQALKKRACILPGIGRTLRPRATSSAFRV